MIVNITKYIILLKLRYKTKYKIIHNQIIQ